MIRRILQECNYIAREEGDSIKPGAQAPGQQRKLSPGARESGPQTMDRPHSNTLTYKNLPDV